VIQILHRSTGSEVLNQMGSTVGFGHLTEAMDEE
jgi:hypothetical protein